jgi:hypothetical protein
VTSPINIWRTRREIDLEALVKDMLEECYALCETGSATIDKAIKARVERAIAGGDPRLL